jgi:hypothetical protein
MEIDSRTQHIANPVVSGTKYSVNFWIHNGAARASASPRSFGGLAASARNAARAIDIPGAGAG